MKRLLALCAALLTLAGPADAYRVMLVKPNLRTNSFTQARFHARSYNTTKEVLDRLGVNYDEVPAATIKTEWARLGQMVRETAPGVSAATQYDAIIFPNFWGAEYNINYHGVNTFVPIAGRMRVDSLFRVTLGGCKVPCLFLIDNSNTVGSGDGIAKWANNTDVAYAAVRCSTGISGSLTNGGALVMYPNRDVTKHWNQMIYNSGFNLDASTIGGVRSVISHYSPPATYGSNADPVWYYNVPWPDSIRSWVGVAADTAVVWDRLWANPSSYGCSGAQPMTFVNWGGAGASDDSLDFVIVGAGGMKTPAEGDIQTLVLGIAHFDSLTGGKVIQSKPGSRPVDASIIVRRGLARNQRVGRGGLLEADKATFYATCDSIAALGCPITFAIDVDSAATFAADLTKMLSISTARFTPEVWCGVLDTANASGGAGNSSYGKPVDVYGMYRNRAAYGDGSAVGADTSVFAGLKRAFQITDSLTNGRTCRIAVAPFDDWSPKGITGQNPARVDSIMWAINRAGAHSILFNRQWPGADAGNANSAAQLNPAGYYGQREEGHYTGLVCPCGSSRWDMNFIGHYGSGLMGAKMQAWAYADSLDGSYDHWIDQELCRFWKPLFQRYDIDYDTIHHGTAIYYPTEVAPSAKITEYYAERGVYYPAEDIGQDYPWRRASVKQLYCSDLSGSTTNPSRVGWWTIKYIYNAVTEVNRAAHRTVINLTYPDQVRP